MQNTDVQNTWRPPYHRRSGGCWCAAVSVLHVGSSGVNRGRGARGAVVNRVEREGSRRGEVVRMAAGSDLEEGSRREEVVRMALASDLD